MNGSFDARCLTRFVHDGLLKSALLPDITLLPRGIKPPKFDSFYQIAFELCS